MLYKSKYTKFGKEKYSAKLNYDKNIEKKNNQIGDYIIEYIACKWLI